VRINCPAAFRRNDVIDFLESIEVECLQISYKSGGFLVRCGDPTDQQKILAQNGETFNGHTLRISRATIPLQTKHIFKMIADHIRIKEEAALRGKEPRRNDWGIRIVGSAPNSRENSPEPTGPVVFRGRSDRPLTRSTTPTTPTSKPPSTQVPPARSTPFWSEQGKGKGGPNPWRTPPPPAAAWNPPPYRQASPWAPPPPPPPIPQAAAWIAPLQQQWAPPAQPPAPAPPQGPSGKGKGEYGKGKGGPASAFTPVPQGKGGKGSLGKGKGLTPPNQPPPPRVVNHICITCKNAGASYNHPYTTCPYAIAKQNSQNSH
jgi:hypothetical protein